MYQFSQTLQTALAAGNPQRALLEFTHKPDGTAYDPAVQFSNEDILLSKGIRLTEEFNSETDLRIGLCPSASIRFDMLNDVNQLAEFEFGTFTAYLGCRIDSGTPGENAKTKTFMERGQEAVYEFAPLGTFIAERPAIVKKKIIDMIANDQMILFDAPMPDAETLGISYPVTLGALCAAICANVGVTLKDETWLNSTMTVQEEPYDFEGSTMRDVLGWIAAAACSNARFSRDGKLAFIWFNPVEKTFDEHDYTEFRPTWYETKPIDGLDIQNSDSQNGITIGEGENIYNLYDNPFFRQPDTMNSWDE